MIAFIGVLSSWLMFARNVLFALFAPSATSRASSSSSFACATPCTRFDDVLEMVLIVAYLGIGFFERPHQIVVLVRDLANLGKRFHMRSQRKVAGFRLLIHDLEEVEEVAGSSMLPHVQPDTFGLRRNLERPNTVGQGGRGVGHTEADHCTSEDADGLRPYLPGAAQPGPDDLKIAEDSDSQRSPYARC